MDPQLDHILTFTDAEDIDSHMEQYRALGFSVSDETRRYKPGLRNRFVTLGPEYLEIVWVENREDFSHGGNEEFGRMYPDLTALQQAVRPFSIGFISTDVWHLHEKWAGRGYRVPQVWSIAPPGSAPVLSFQEIPTDVLPGARCFAITYHNISTTRTMFVQRAINATYAIEGLTFVSEAPKEAATHWQRLFNPGTEILLERDVYHVPVPPHHTWWMTAGIFQGQYGIPWIPTPHPYGQLAAIHLLSLNLEVTTSVMRQRVIKRVPGTPRGECLVVSPTGRDGVIFIIRQFPIEQWRVERMDATGEMIVLA